ncbi:MAG: signal peptidase I [Schaedlerella sp.]|nr:signal peptidase I [Schaedlerella sp.]
MTEVEKNKPTFTTEQIEQELKRVRYKERYGRTLRSTIYALITVAAIAVLVAVLLLPVFQIYGHSMTPTLDDGDIVLSVKSGSVESQDIIAFYYNNKILVKRVIAEAGQWVDIDEAGNVRVDGTLLYEPYLTDKAKGECDIEMPYQVPEGKVFVMGDHRSVSADSRSLAIGCVSEEQIVGKLVMCVWPLQNIGRLEK